MTKRDDSSHQISAHFKGMAKGLGILQQKLIEAAEIDDDNVGLYLDASKKARQLGILCKDSQGTEAQAGQFVRKGLQNMRRDFEKVFMHGNESQKTDTFINLTAAVQKLDQLAAPKSEKVRKVPSGLTQPA